MNSNPSNDNFLTFLRPPKHEARIAAPQLKSIDVGLNEFQEPVSVFQGS